MSECEQVLSELNRLIDIEWANLRDWGEEYLFTAQSILRFRDTLQESINKHTAIKEEANRLYGIGQEYDAENAALKRENDKLRLALETTNALLKDVY